MKIPYNNNFYHRFHIDIQPTPDIETWPSRFDVKVDRIGLAKLLLSEMFHYKFNTEVLLSRPCMYGVFSGPVGGFAPQPQHCVGCLRCTTEFPDFVEISHNPDRQKLGDSFFNFNVINAISYESESGQVPVKGAGYRGKFGGAGWDGMWTDMSEIVRPTRDGIHGREVISTQVDIGSRPNFLQFTAEKQLMGNVPNTFPIQVPFIFDDISNFGFPSITNTALVKAANNAGTYAILPIDLMPETSSNSAIPLIQHHQIDLLSALSPAPKMIIINGWDERVYDEIQETFRQSIIALRIDFPSNQELIKYTDKGVRTFHLIANFHGKDKDGNFVLDLIRNAHKALVDEGIRQEVTLIGGGGIIAAEHLPKAILCGLDAVSLDTALMVAMQAKFQSDTDSREKGRFTLPTNITEKWATQRLTNLTGSWHSQLLEIMGAMGLREVRRMRGEMGRAMFMKDLEKEAFAGIEGYSHD